MDYVNFETAKQLKEAGFPQPEFKTGQIWYNAYGDAYLLSRKEVMRMGVFFLTRPESGMQSVIDLSAGDYSYFAFAPTATDILRELPVEFYLSCDKDGKFHLYHNEYDWGDNLRHLQLSEHPADLCAAVWVINI